MDITNETKFKTTSPYYKKQYPVVDKLFNDPLFPPNNNSLTFLDPNNINSKDVTPEELKAMNNIVWKRPKEIFNQPFKVCDIFEVEDIKQGELGNCYFLSAVSSLAEISDRYNHLFINRESQYGCYQLRIMIQGIPKIVTIDDYFPVKRNKFAFASSVRNEIWVPLLEKAWAKINKSYAATIAGFPSEALYALSHAPVITLIHRKLTEDELFEKLKDADEKNYVICTNTSSNPEAQKYGLMTSHAYSLIQIYEFKNLKLLKLRNPWGGGEWSGDYSDTSPLWTKDLKNFVNYLNKEDGIFFMSLKDFITYFPSSYICKYKDNYNYEYKKVQQSDRDCFTTCKFIITSNTNITVSLHQKQTRFYSKIKNYKPRSARLFLARYEKQKYEYIGSDYSENEQLHIEAQNLEIGEYHIFANINWEFDSRCNYIISTYSDNKIQIEENNIILNNYLEEILKSYLNKHIVKGHLLNNDLMQFSYRDNKTGFLLFYYKNNTQSKDISIEFSVAYNNKIEYKSNYVLNRKFSEFEGIKEIQDSILFTVGPGEDKLLVWRLLAEFWYCKFRYSLPNGYLKDHENIEKETIDNYKSAISKELKNSYKENLNSECFYTEMETIDEIILIIENKSITTNYQFKINFSNLKNLDGAEELSFIIKPNNFRYVRMSKINININYSYDFRYSYKRI